MVSIIITIFVKNLVNMDSNRPLILISNDDGVEAPGLRFLIESVRHLGRIIAVAPALPHSGMSSAITVNAPLRITPFEETDDVSVYSVSGTPVDCVKLGLHALVPRKPDLMLSGINHGSNAGNSVIYSGTMGAALEACMSGITAIGYSLLSHSLDADFSPTRPLIESITRSVMASGLPEGVCLNVNFPAGCAIEGAKTVRAARGYWTEEFEKFIDPHGKPFYWLTGRFHNLEPDNPETDEYWLHRRYASIVPVRADQSATDLIPALIPALDLP